MFYIFLTYGFGYGLRPKAEVFQGRTFGYGRRWKLHLRSNTEKLQRDPSVGSGLKFFIFRPYGFDYLGFFTNARRGAMRSKTQWVFYRDLDWWPGPHKIQFGEITGYPKVEGLILALLWWVQECVKWNYGRPSCNIYIIHSYILGNYQAFSSHIYVSRWAGQE